MNNGRILEKRKLTWEFKKHKNVLEQKRQYRLFKADSASVKLVSADEIIKGALWYIL